MKCKHQDGEFIEFVNAEHSRLVEQGRLVEDGFANNPRDITGYLYICALCKNRWYYKSPKQKRLAKWLEHLHYNAFAPWQAS